MRVPSLGLENCMAISGAVYQHLARVCSESARDACTSEMLPGRLRVSGCARSRPGLGWRGHG